MARAETMESGGGGDHPAPRHNTCRMELPRPFHPWPSIIHHQHHLLHPLQALYLPCQLPALHPEGMEEPQTHQPPSPSSASPPPSPPCSRRDESDGNGDTHRAYSGGKRTDSEREDHHEVSSRRGPLPDLLPQNEHPSWGLPHHRAPGAEEAELALEVRRVGSQLRAIGDELNATVLCRAAAPLWHDWGGVWRGLLTFISDTLSTLYQLT